MDEKWSGTQCAGLEVGVPEAVEWEDVVRTPRRKIFGVVGAANTAAAEADLASARSDHLTRWR